MALHDIWSEDCVARKTFNCKINSMESISMDLFQEQCVDIMEIRAFDSGKVPPRKHRSIHSCG